LFALPTTSEPVASTSTAPAQTLLSLLNPTLLSSFLDAAPSAFSPTPVIGQSSQAASAELRTITAVLRVARELFYRDLGGNASSTLDESSSSTPNSKSRPQARKLLFSLLSHAAPYFPFGADELQERTSAEEQQLLQLNLTFAELVSLLVLSEEEETLSQSRASGGSDKKNSKKASKAQSDSSKLSHILSTVQTWVIAALNCTLTSSTHPLGLPPLSVDAFMALEPTLWSLLNQRDAEGVENVWSAVLTGWGKMTREGEARRRVFEFIARAVLVRQVPLFCYLESYD